MSEPKPTIPDLETLNAAAARLYERAVQINQITLSSLAADLRFAAMICTRLADIRQRLAEIAENVLAHESWDAAAHRRDLLELISPGEASDLAVLERSLRHIDQGGGHGENR